MKEDSSSEGKGVEGYVGRNASAVIFLTASFEFEPEKQVSYYCQY